MKNKAILRLNHDGTTLFLAMPKSIAERVTKSLTPYINEASVVMPLSFERELAKKVAKFKRQLRAQAKQANKQLA